MSEKFEKIRKHMEGLYEFCSLQDQTKEIFFHQYETLVNHAKRIPYKPSEGAIKDEMKSINRAATKLLETLSSSHQVTLNRLDCAALDHQEQFQEIRELFGSDSKYPVYSDSKGVLLIDQLSYHLDELQIHTSSAMGIDTRQNRERTWEFRNEVALAALYSKYGGKVTEGQFGQFAKVLEIFRLDCDKENSASDVAKQISRINEELKTRRNRT